jgi:AraC-like DNA-binding protein
MKIVKSISQYHRLISLPEPMHPLISVIDLAKVRFLPDPIWNRFGLDFYCISLKHNLSSKTRYGQGYYDHNFGVMSFVGPRQLLSLEKESLGHGASGHMLLIHRDFLFGHPLAEIINEYGFFSYATHEALHLSEVEETNVMEIFSKIHQEYADTDEHSQDIMLSHIDLLLKYSKRFYQRQFLTRKAINHQVLDTMEQLLREYFNAESLSQGLPTVSFVAAALKVSPHYLTDLLRSLTGQNAQQHIQSALIDRAKYYLSTTELSVSEIAYRLGFGVPQSFHKLFKKRTDQSPLSYRQANSKF